MQRLVYNLLSVKPKTNKKIQSIFLKKYIFKEFVNVRLWKKAHSTEATLNVKDFKSLNKKHRVAGCIKNTGYISLLLLINADHWQRQTALRQHEQCKGKNSATDFSDILFVF